MPPWTIRVRARSYGRLTRPGRYSTTITRPSMFAGYLSGQIDLLIEDYGVEVTVGRSDQQIPFPYVLDTLPAGTLGATPPTELARYFPTTELAEIGDEIADGLFLPGLDGERPLALFDALRTDFSLARLRHYTGTPPEHVQRFVLFTNYHRYVDEFVRWGCTGAEAAGHALYSAFGLRRRPCDRGDGRPGRHGGRERLAQTSDARLSHDRPQPRRHHARQYRRRAFQRQDDL